MKLINKQFFLVLFSAVALFSLAACADNSSMSSTFPNIRGKDLPDVLEVTVGTVGDTYYTSFEPSGDNDYSAYFRVVYEDVTREDYNELMKHYQSVSIGTSEEGMLFFDWGHLKVASDRSSISVEAYIM